MRHRKIKGRLNRRSSWRKATLKLMASDLIQYQRIETTMAKAKALKSFAEPLITIAKNSPDSVAARRQVFSKLCDRSAVTLLFNEVAPLYKEIPGGYTRIMPLGNRRGDGAQLVIIELTKRTISDEDLLGKPELKPQKKPLKKGKKSEAEKETSEKSHAAPERDADEKEERGVEDVKKEQAKREQKKVASKGIFKRFRRKSI